jgi:hypothetical protein
MVQVIDSDSDNECVIVDVEEGSQSPGRSGHEKVWKPLAQLPAINSRIEWPFCRAKIAAVKTPIHNQHGRTLSSGDGGRSTKRGRGEPRGGGVGVGIAGEKACMAGYIRWALNHWSVELLKERAGIPLTAAQAIVARRPFRGYFLAADGVAADVQDAEGEKSLKEQLPDIGGNLLKRVWLALKMHCRLWLALKNDSRQRPLETSQDSVACFVARQHAGFAGNTAFAVNAGQQPRQQRFDVGQGVRGGSAVLRTPAHAYGERMRAQAQPVAAPVVDVGGRERARERGGLPRLGFDLCQHNVERAECELCNRSALINMLTWSGGCGAEGARGAGARLSDMNQKDAASWWQDKSSWRQLGQQQVSQVSAAIPLGIGGRPMQGVQGMWGSRMCADVPVPRAPECALAHPAHAHRLEATGSLFACDNWGTAVETKGQLAGRASCASGMMMRSHAGISCHGGMSSHRHNSNNGGPSCGAAGVGSKDGAVTLGFSWDSAHGPSVGFSHGVGGSDWGAQVCRLE